MTTAFINQYFAQIWAREKLTPAARASDEIFIRRASLDLAGRIAAPADVLAFVKDDAADKRPRLIDRLLASDDYLDYWASLWVSWLLPRTQAVGTKFIPYPALYRQQLHAWLAQERQLVKLNHAQLVERLLTAVGKTNELGAVHFLLANLGTPNPPGRTAQEGAFDMVPATLRTLRLFLGHNLYGLHLPAQPKRHPDWKEQHFWSINVFFRQTDREGQPLRLTFEPPPVLALRDNVNYNAKGVLFFEKPDGTVLPAEAAYLDRRRTPDDTRLSHAMLFGGSLAGAAFRQEQEQRPRRRVLAEFITADPQFARAYVNRVWGQLFGRGLNEKPAVDNFGRHNEVVHPDLLARLARDFAAAKYDPRALLRWIAVSDVYQLGSAANETNDDADLNVHFSRMPVRPLGPEQLTASLLRLIHPRAAAAFAESCTAWFAQRFEGNEWEDVPLPDRLAHLLRFLNRKETAAVVLADDSPPLAQAAAEPDRAKVLVQLYLAILNRLPTAAEAKAIQAELAPGKELRECWRDLAWALVNCSEFVLQH